MDCRITQCFWRRLIHRSDPTLALLEPPSRTNSSNFAFSMVKFSSLILFCAKISNYPRNLIYIIGHDGIVRQTIRSGPLILKDASLVQERAISDKKLCTDISATGGSCPTALCAVEIV